MVDLLIGYFPGEEGVAGKEPSFTVFPGLLIAEGGDASYSRPTFGGAVDLFLTGVIGTVGEPEVDIL